MSAGDQNDADLGLPGAGRFIGTIRRKPLTARRAAGIIGSYTVIVTFAGGLVGWLADRKDFPTLGDGLWWSLQTVTTVGYGDITPSAGTGRLIGAFVMISGIAFLTVITAAVTATLIEAARSRLPRRPASEPPPEFMREVTARLSAIEGRLDELASRSDD
jgi:voltage-gated potassium channel